MSELVYYITSHGFGHATRAIEIINHIPEDISVEIVTAVPEWLFQHSLNRSFAYHHLLHDPGIAQVHSLKQDVNQTYQAWYTMLQHYPQMAEAEAKRVISNGANLLVGDISPFTVLVAKQANLQSVIVANFSWDWICQGFTQENPAFEEIIQQFKTIYSQCDLLLRTPLSDGLDIFPNIVDIPLIVRHAQRTKDEVRQELSLSPDQPTVLISFGGHGFDQLQPDNITKYSDITFLTFDERFASLPNTRLLNAKTVYHPDYLNASNLVLAKLGYGIVTECIAHHKAIAYPPRMGFPEYQVLEKEMAHFVSMLKLEEDAFYQGQWDALRGYLYGFEQKTSYDECNSQGGQTAAQILIQQLERSQS